MQFYVSGLFGVKQKMDKVSDSFSHKLEQMKKRVFSAEAQILTQTLNVVRSNADSLLALIAVCGVYKVESSSPEIQGG